MGELSPALSYIISDVPIAQWSEEKQKAIWNTKKVEVNGKTIDGGLIIQGWGSVHDGPSIYDKEAIDYATYYDEILKNEEAGKEGLAPEDYTNIDEVYTKVDSAARTYTIGPLKLNYTTGTYGELAFGGISDIYLVGYNKSGSIVKERIDIQKFVIGTEEKNPEFFEADEMLVDETEQVYPEPEQDFEIIFENPNEGIASTDPSFVSKVKVKVKFQYMVAQGHYSKLKGTKYTVAYNHDEEFDHTHWIHYDEDGECTEECYEYDHYKCETTCYLDEKQQQWQMSAAAGRKLYEQELELEVEQKLTMDLAGYVWVDGGLNDKQNTPYNGMSGDSNDVALPDIRAILYEDSGDKVEEKVTDEEGCYIFNELDSQKKYYVVFEYNGQLYVPTTYNRPEYNSDEWKKTSKATEKDSERDGLNQKFASIEAYPNNYSGGEVYSMQQLVQDGVIDSFFAIENGIIVETNELHRATSSPSGSQESFMNDCKIMAYTKSREVEDISGFDLYPYYDQFFINSKESFSTGSEARNANISSANDVMVGGKTYKPLYPGQFYIDLGLVRRKINDLALKKDVFRAVTKINGKTEVYTYNRTNDDDDSNWDISVRLSDVSYYGTGYEREVFKSDWNYNPNAQYNGSQSHGGKALEVFVTYKITLRNQSRGILNTVDEVADYFDSEYKYREDLSWVTYDNNSFNNNEYFKTMDKEDLKYISNAKNVDSAEANGVIYVHGLKNKQLAAGEKECIYLTFQVNKENNKVILDQSENDAKFNVAEINGYTSYYENGTELPNGVIKGSSDYAGLIDIDSVPGNVSKNDLQNEREYEDDTDRAKGIRIFYDDSNTRKINGIVWEDLRTEVVGDAIIGDGIKNDGNTGIENIKVELVEKLANGQEYIWKTTTLGNTNQEKTGSDGKYLFEDYIPGDYIVRFTYGGEYNSKYNGQDYKSTTYQKGIDQNGRTNLENASNEIVSVAQQLGRKLYYGYTNVENQNTSGSYGYNITKSNGQSVSDAKDIWSNREEVNKYSSNNYTGVTNELAQILANTNVANTNTQMKAETGVISIEVEYNRLFTSTEGNAYHIKDIDLGLTERPKAQLELDKHVEKVKITLANGTTLYDAEDAVPDLSWTKGKDYSLINNSKYYKSYNSAYKYDASQNDVNSLVGSLYTGGKNGLIQAIVDSELMHGATIKIEYKFTLKNVGETDYTGKAFYYNGIKSGDVVTTSGDVIVDYVSNNLQYREVDNTEWKTTGKSSLSVSDAVKGVIGNNTIIQTEKLSKKLSPKDSISGNLILTQTITSQNTSDDMTYDNIAEIVQYSNTVGRRMAYSVVGNQNPNDAPTEVDTAKAEKIIILPPFGQTYLYLGVGIAVFALLTVGIIIIKKKVLKK